MEIRFFKYDEWDILIHSIEKLWRKNHVYCRNQELLKYLVYNTPYREKITGKENTSFVGMFDNNEVIGLVGMIPQEANIFGRRALSNTGTIWIVDDKYKTEGLELLNFVMSHNPVLHIGTGINSRVAKMYKLLKWEVFEDFPRWIGICNKRRVKEIFGLNENFLLDNIKEVSVKLNDVCACKFSDVLEENKWNSYYNNNFAIKTIGVARDYKFLKWRYIDYRFFEYKIILICDKNENYRGLAVYRVETINGGHDKISRILEFIYDDLSYGIQLAQKMIFQEPDILFWDFYCLSSITAVALEYIGFVRMPNNESEKYIPTRFQPIDFNEMNIRGTIFIDNHFKKYVNLVTDQQWYVTKGDADQDRPN